MFKILSVLIGVSQAAYDYSPLIPMSKYGWKYRTLTVWECFEAKGKFCINKDYSSMILTTGSSNRAHGICCKVDYEGPNCRDDE